jgi:hypothetical protein
MLRNIAILILLTIPLISDAQERSLPSFAENLPKDKIDRNWYLKILKATYPEFIAFTEYSTWTNKYDVRSLAFRNDSTFIVTITKNRSDTSEVKSTSKAVDRELFLSIIDTLKRLGLFDLKDETQVEPCKQLRRATLNGKKEILTSSTAYIEDGVQSEILIFSDSKLRFVGYYELSEAERICPSSKVWKQANMVRNYLSGILQKHSRHTVCL